MPERQPDLNHPERAVQVTIGREVRLGLAKKSPKPKIQLADYVDLEQVLPLLRRTVGHAVGLNDFKMCGNDTLGDCTAAAVEHGTHIIQWQDDHGADNAENEQRAIDLYWATGTQDDGRMITDVLGYVRRNGYGGRSDAIIGYAGIDPANFQLIATAIDLLGGVDIGISLPVTAQNQHRKWDVVGDPTSDPDSQPGSWGGHSVWVQGYNRLQADNQTLAGAIPLVTWGERFYMTQRFFDAYTRDADGGEVYAVLSAEWLNKQGASPRGFDLAALESDLNAIKK